MGLDDVRPKELLICKIDKIHPYGVTVSLEEYPDLQGFVPLSQIANRWIKNIRNFVRVGQIKVGIVLSVNRERRQIDISFSRVSPIDDRKKMISWRETKRSQQLLGRLAKELKVNSETLWNEIVPPILEKYDSVTDAFKEMLELGPTAVKEVPEKYRIPLAEIIKKSMAPTRREVIENIEMQICSGNGLMEIKDLFANIPSSTDVEQTVSYSGGGKYQIKFDANNYKKIEKLLKEVNDYLVSKVGKKGTINIKRKE